MDDQPTPYRAQHLKDALVADARVGELGLEVSEVAGTMYVRGVVATEDQRAAVDEVAREVLPEVRCVNETTVKQIGEPKDEESIR